MEVHGWNVEETVKDTQALLYQVGVLQVEIDRLTGQLVLKQAEASRLRLQAVGCITRIRSYEGASNG